ncbi:MAG: hypothetical protein ABW101_19525 [Candidatus Thiodiazotropha sp.]
MKFSFWPLLILSGMSALQAGGIPEQQVLTFDQPIPGSLDLRFSEGDDLAPKRGDFRIESCLLMSNPSGERWAVVTLRNLSTSQRLLDEEHLVALFADGSRRNPINTGYTFRGSEQNTLTMSFGESPYPIVRVEVRN